MKKILIYNWIPFDEKENKGGGVSVYTQNLIRHLILQKGWKIYFLSSGRAYDIWRKKIFIEPTGNVFGEACKSFQIVNSPVLSSARLSFSSLWNEYEDIVLKQVVRQFFLKEGEFENLFIPCTIIIPFVLELCCGRKTLNIVKKTTVVFVALDVCQKMYTDGK